MSDTPAPSAPQAGSPPSVTSPSDSASPPASQRRWDWRPKVRWFTAEIVVVVAGVLIALALNAWWQGRQDAASERTYLMLLSRDLDQMEDNLQELIEMEDERFQNGLQAYRILSLSAPSDSEKALASESLASLLSRRTMNTTDATYQDLLSTGGLQLLRNRTIRHRLVAFYEEAQRRFDIHNKNNAIFVDELFVREMLVRGLIYNRSRPDSSLNSQLTPGYADEPDPLWRLPTTAPEWPVVRAVLLQRIRVASYARNFADVQLAETRELQRAIEIELNSGG